MVFDLNKESGLIKQVFDLKLKFLNGGLPIVIQWKIRVWARQWMSFFVARCVWITAPIGLVEKTFIWKWFIYFLDKFCFPLFFWVFWGCMLFYYETHKKIIRSIWCKLILLFYFTISLFKSKESGVHYFSHDVAICEFCALDVRIYTITFQHTKKVQQTLVLKKFGTMYI